MLGFMRRTSAISETNKILDNISQIIHWHVGMIGSDIWGDPYVMGYFASVIGASTQFLSNSSFNQEQGGAAIGDCWTRISGLPSLPFKIATIEMSNGRNAEYCKGFSDAIWWTAFHFRIPKRGNPTVEKILDDARTLARVNSKATDGQFDELTSATAMLLQRDLLARITLLKNRK